MEVHRFSIHLRVLESLFILVFFSHGLDTNSALIDTDKLFVTLLKHFLWESGISGSDVQYFVLFINIGCDYVLDSTESLVPVEGLGVS